MTRKNKVAVLGFGSQGKAIAQNLRDSGYGVTVGLRVKSKSVAVARKAKIPTASIHEAAASADLIIIALPDHVHGRVLNRAFFAKLPKPPALVFLHGSSVHFRMIEPPAEALLAVRQRRVVPNVAADLTQQTTVGSQHPCEHFPHQTRYPLR